MITQFHLQLHSMDEERPLLLTAVTAAQLHGFLFRTILPAANSNETTWLHEHPSPKPFALAPVTDKSGQLMSVRLVAFTERAAALLRAGSAWAQAAPPLRLADYDVQVTAVMEDKTRPFVNLLNARAYNSMTLHFLTPTAFKQGPRRLHLPVPVNVFDRPAAIWRMYAPPAIQLPSDWLDWCEANVYVLEHHIHTTKQAINARGTFAGFVGKVQFISADADETYLRLWQGLGRLASYCGVGSKTTMGMGVVAWSRRASERKASADQKEIA
jgi:CRISPR-associated endoribonuclease Cas6